MFFGDDEIETLHHRFNYHKYFNVESSTNKQRLWITTDTPNPSYIIIRATDKLMKNFEMCIQGNVCKHMPSHARLFVVLRVLIWLFV